MKLVFSIVEAILFPLIGLGSMFLIYICLLWCVVVTTTTTRHSVSTTTTSEEEEPPPVIKPLSNNGLSLSELQKLPITTIKTGKLDDDHLHECSVCLDEICIEEEAARVIPGCNHTFHLECADRWLSNNRFCPLCRTQIQTPC